MKDWIGLTVAFALGLAVGVALSSFFFESRIRFYKLYIEQRLASINRVRSTGTKTRRLHKFSFLRGILSRRSKQGEGSGPFHNK